VYGYGSLPTWGEKFHAATACRGLQFGCVSTEQREKHANPTWCMEFPMSHLFLFFPHHAVFPSGVISSFRPYPPSSQDQASCGGGGPTIFRELEPFASPTVQFFRWTETSPCLTKSLFSTHKGEPISSTGEMVKSVVPPPSVPA